MPKKKTCKAAAKRFRVSAGGRVKYGRPGKGHLQLCKSRKRKRHLKTGGILSKPEEIRIRGLLAT